MKKRIAFRKLGRTSSHKWAMLRNMVTSLIKHERIVTTLAKAKELRHLADQMVTFAKAQEDKRLHAIRQANKVIREEPVLTKLFQVLGPRYALRQGGYTRILKLSKKRPGDNAEMAVMEYVDRPGELRAAKPPKPLQEQVMARYWKELGIDPIDSADAVAAVEQLGDDFAELKVADEREASLATGESEEAAEEEEEESDVPAEEDSDEKATGDDGDEKSSQESPLPEEKEASDPDDESKK